MKTIYIQELKAYSKIKLLELLNHDEKAFNKLLAYAIIKNEKDIYHFRFVGVIIIDNLVINVYPKYIPENKFKKSDFKQVLKVIKKYNSFNYDLEYQNENLEDISYNQLSMMIFFLEDYFENGLYSNIQNILEVNGNGEIDWNRTINYTNPIIKDSKPYYVELYTKRKIDDLFDYFRLLHEYIITECSKKLEKAGLMDLFDLTPVELSSKNLDDFGETSIILENLEKELHLQFNTQKIRLLKSMHAYLSEKNSFSDKNYLTVYGTSTYHEIWEAVCSKVFKNKLYKPFKNLKINSASSDTIMNLIKKPKWVLKSGKYHEARKSFEPDIVTFDDETFYILDAKYYKLKFDEGTLDGHPGLGDITKQYIYQLALNDFVADNHFKNVKNAFLFPKYDGEIENLGHIEIEILSNLNLENIQVIMLPAEKIYQYYLEIKKINVSSLELN
ncbi:LlaJI family restriction endonuclease [Methanobrevibacter sp.]|uniref:LlaJI family restriction endonuclease n=1 Tax=Methanobrevibacter sp. TaxID=66852 RepID=UPI00388FE03E